MRPDHDPTRATDHGEDTATRPFSVLDGVDVYDEAAALEHDRWLAAELEESGVDVTPPDDRLPEQIDTPSTTLAPKACELPYAFEDLLR